MVDDLVKAKCIGCGHTELILSIGFTLGPRLSPDTRCIRDLEPQLRCREWEPKGKAVVSIRWMGG